MRSKTHRKIINKSIQNLGMDYVDVYIDYMWDWSTPIYDILEILNIINKIKFSWFNFLFFLCNFKDFGKRSNEKKKKNIRKALEKGRFSNDYLEQMSPWNKLYIFIILSLETLWYIPGSLFLVSRWRCLGMEGRIPTLPYPYQNKHILIFKLVFL